MSASATAADRRPANPWEELARERKAFKLSRVLLHVMRRNPRFTIEDVAAASPVARETAARIAGVNVPSDQTWARMIELVVEQRRRMPRRQECRR